MGYGIVDTDTRNRSASFLAIGPGNPGLAFSNCMISGFEDKFPVLCRFRVSDLEEVGEPLMFPGSTGENVLFTSLSLSVPGVSGGFTAG